MTAAATRPLDSPRLLPLLPMLYIAWSDGDLTATEIQDIRKAAADPDLFDPFCLEQLETWLNPDEPPSAIELRRMLRRIHRAASKLPVQRRLSLAELGMELAKHDLDASGDPNLDRKTYAGLQQLERALGVVGHEAVQALLPLAPPDAAPPAEEEPARFDVARMTELLDGEEADQRGHVREFLAASGWTYRYDWTKAEHRAQVTEWTRSLAENGFGAIAYPGVVSDVRDLSQFIATFETLAYFDLSLVVKYGVQFGLFGGSIFFLGTERHQSLLHDVAAMRLPGCFAMTEAGHGSNVRDLETTAIYDAESGEIVVNTPTDNARKHYIGNAARDGRMATVFAQLEVAGERFGVHAVLVPIRDENGETMPGVRIEDCGHKMGLNGVDNGQIWFDNVRVPRTNLLNRYGDVSVDGEYSSPISSESKRFFTMLGALVGGRVSVACAGLSAAKSALAIAIHRGARRRQFGADGAAETPILDYQTHQTRLMPLLARTYAFNFALRDLARRFVSHTGDDSREVESLAAGLKSLATWHCTETIQTARECCGGAGYLSENRFGSLKADTDVFTTFEGDNTVLLQLVAKSLLTAFKRQFHDNRYFAMLRFVAHRAATAVAELNPLTVRRTDTEHLRDPEFQSNALRYREETIVTHVAQSLRARIDDGEAAFDAFLFHQQALVDAASAHVERHVLDMFDEAIERYQDRPGRAVLVDLRDLFALDVIERDMGWFMEAGYIESPKAEAIGALRLELCSKVRAQAIHLVDAWAIPDRVLAAPIATR